MYYIRIVSNVHEQTVQYETVGVEETADSMPFIKPVKKVMYRFETYDRD